MHYKCTCSISCRANKRDLEFYQKQVQVELYAAVRSFFMGLGVWRWRPRTQVVTGAITDADR